MFSGSVLPRLGVPFLLLLPKCLGNHIVLAVWPERHTMNPNIAAIQDQKTGSSLNFQFLPTQNHTLRAPTPNFNVFPPPLVCGQRPVGSED